MLNDKEIPVIYIRCVNCGAKFEGEPKLTFEAWTNHFSKCKTIRDIWCWNRIHLNILKRDNYECTECSSKENLEVHHILRIIDGGTNNPANLLTLCEHCHNRRHFKTRSERLRKYQRSELLRKYRSLHPSGGLPKWLYQKTGGKFHSL